jgi:NAD(P)-dependent dehydrogenase (short-subunit alcohol dehydrogenase family)
MKLEGLAIVTGAASGIGLATAKRLSRDGASVALFDLDPEGLVGARQSIEADEGTAADFVVDVTDPASVAVAVHAATAKFGPPRVLVNCAGIVIRKPLLETTPEEWHRIIGVNLMGCVNTLQEVIPRMKASGGGSIIQIASTAAHLGGHGYTSYTATKGAVVSMTRQLAGDLADDNIRINSLCPGAVVTGINREAFGDPEVKDAMAGAIPMKRIGDPDEIANAVAFLAGPDSTYITGADLRVDGGLSSRVNLAGRGGRTYDRFESERADR